jgi:hypothetical protein
MLTQTIKTAAGTYTLTFPDVSATLATLQDVSTTSIETAPSIGGSFSKIIYVNNQAIGGAPDSALNVEGQAEKYITVPSDGTWFAEMTLASYDPQQSMIVKEKIKFTVAGGVYTYVSGWEAQQHQTWVKSPDGLYPSVSANVWLIADNALGSYGIRADVYGFYAAGCDYRGSIVFSQEIGSGTIQPTISSATSTAVGDETSQLTNDGNPVFEQVTVPGRYLHKVRVMGTSGPGGNIVFYAEPVFEMQYNGANSQFVAGYAKNIIIQGNNAHDIVILQYENGYNIEVHGPSSGTTDFSATLQVPELISTTLLAVPTVYDISGPQFQLAEGQTYALDLNINNGALSGGVLPTLTNGTYTMVGNFISVEVPNDFNVTVTKRYVITDAGATITEDVNYYDYTITYDNTSGATGEIVNGTNPISGATGIYVRATGWAVPSTFTGTLTVTPVLS